MLSNGRSKLVLLEEPESGLILGVIFAHEIGHVMVGWGHPHEGNCGVVVFHQKEAVHGS